MKFGFGMAIAAAAIFLTGCATPQAPVAMSEGSLSSKSGKVGISVSSVPKPDTYFPGASCLLCYAFASASNSALTTHVKTLPTDDLDKLGQEVADALRKKGVEAVVLREPIGIKDLPNATGDKPNTPKQDFSALRDKLKVDKLLLVQWGLVGYERPYSSYVPTSDPKAMVRGLGYMVDLRTNTYDWFQDITVLKAADGTWDEAPKFPGLTNAYFQALEGARDGVLKPLSAAAR
jgi:hypothetical protein